MAHRACIAILAAATAACASLGGPELEAELVPSLELPAPSAVRARSGELRAVPLSWQAVLGREVAGYAVERAAGDGEAFVRITVVPGQFAAAHVDRSPELRDGESYRYVVRSVAADGRVGVATSPVASATTATPPEPPPELEAYSHQPRRVALQWRASPDATVVGYRVERAAAAEGPFTTLASSQGRFATTYVDEGLGDLRVLYYRVAAVNAAGEPGEPGTAVRAVTKAEPLPPLGLRIADKGLGRKELAWEPNVETDISAYRLERAGHRTRWRCRASATACAPSPGPTGWRCTGTPAVPRASPQPGSIGWAACATASWGGWKTTASWTRRCGAGVATATPSSWSEPTAARHRPRTWCRSRSPPSRAGVCVPAPTA